jgi:hypothetical protein
VEVDGDAMVARLVRLAFKAPTGEGRLHGRQLLSPRDVEIRLPTRVGGLARAVCLSPRASRSRTCCARWRLVMRGGDLSCEAETCRARQRFVGEVATRVKIGCLAGAGS